MILYNFVKWLYLSITYNRLLNKVYREEGILEGLSKLLGVNLKQDWIGRVYAVINPYIKDGKYDREAPVYELGNDMPSDIITENYIMSRLAIASRFIRSNNLFDLLVYDIRKLDEDDNFLFIMQPIPYANLWKWTKWLISLIMTILMSMIIFLMIF